MTGKVRVWWLMLFAVLIPVAWARKGIAAAKQWWPR